MIKRNTAIVSLLFPQQDLEKLNRWAKLERKTKTELIKEAWSLYRTWRIKRDIKYLRKLGEQTRKKFNFKTEDGLYDFIHGD